VYDERGNAVKELDPLMRRTVVDHDAWGQQADAVIGAFEGFI